MSSIVSAHHLRPNEDHPIISAIRNYKIARWIYDFQNYSLVPGYLIYQHLNTTGLITDFVGAGELKAIRSMGPNFFLEYFHKDDVLVGWGGVEGDSVPCLFLFDNRVLLNWMDIRGNFGPCSQGLHRI